MHYSAKNYSLAQAKRSTTKPCAYRWLSAYCSISSALSICCGVHCNACVSPWGLFHQHFFSLNSNSMINYSAITQFQMIISRPRQTGRHFADDIFKCIFLNENVWIPIKISLKFVPKCPINNNPSLVQIMVWRRTGTKPLFEPMMGSLLTHICVTRPQWVNQIPLTNKPPVRGHSVCVGGGAPKWHSNNHEALKH